jgi:hypothetical protein
MKEDNSTDQTLEEGRSVDDQSSESWGNGSNPNLTGTPGTPFFADVVMDLNEAHDLAETPDAARPRFNPAQFHQARIDRIKLPSLGTSLDTMAELPVEENAVKQPGDADPATESRSGTLSRISNFETDRRNMPPPRNPPRWPRDIPWAVSFCIFVPISLVWPILNWERHATPSSLAVHPLSTATLHTLFWAGAATLVLSRALYRTPGGGDGDDARHVLAIGMTVAAPISVAVNIALALLILYSCPGARIGAAIPIWYTVRDLYLFRRWRRRSHQAGSGSRQAFFQALVAMVLDILSRSLRRASFFRVLTLILAIQFGVIVLWRWAILVALGQSPFVVLVTIVGFKWATGVVARMLSLIASGGVMAWFAQQSRLAQEAPPQGEVSEQSSEDFPNERNITEAYLTVDAAVYQSVADMDDVLDDDDYEEDDDEFMEAPSRREHTRREHETAQSTVKSILYAGLTVSFGSVVQCGLLGGLAQFTWSQIRKVEQYQSLFNRRDTDFQGMQIGSGEASIVAKLWAQVMAVARGFVKGHSDLAMCHVAAYHKSYQRAARDVATLIEDSGTLSVSSHGDSLSIYCQLTSCHLSELSL